MTLCGLPREDHAASGVRIRFVRRRLAVGKRGDRIAAFLNAALETDGPAALQAGLGYIAEASGSPKKEESPGHEERSMRTGLGAHPHSAAYPHLAPAAHPHSAAYPHLAPSHTSAFGRLSASGPQPLIRAWRRHQGKKKRVSRISLAAHSRMAAGLQEPPRTSPQSRCACVGRLGSDAHLRLAAGL